MWYLFGVVWSPRCAFPFRRMSITLPDSSVAIYYQGRTLEELEWVYNQPNPFKASKRMEKVLVQEDGGIVVKEEL